MSFQQVFILGNAGKDAEARHLDGGNAVASFTIATSESFKDRSGNRTEKTEWHNVKCFGKVAEFAEKFVKRGSAFFVVGRIRSERYTDRSGNEKTAFYILADTVQFAGTKPKADQQPKDYPSDVHPVNNPDLPF